MKWNEALVDYPENLSVHEQLKLRAEQNPNAIAIVAPGRKPLTYCRLQNHIDDVVGKLNTIGLSRHDRVAIALPNGPEMAAAFLAIAAGATCAPLNPTYQANEFDFYLSDLNAKALIIQSGIDSPATAIAQARGIPIIELSPVIEAEAGIFTLTGSEPSYSVSNGFAQPHDVALVLHTSGTTSRPKIVPLTHANLFTSANNIRIALKLVESDRCLNLMPLFHIHGLIGALLSSIISGGSVICTPGFNAPQFFGWLEEFRPTWYSAVPTMHQAILTRAEANSNIIARYPVRLIRSSSAALPPRVMAELEAVFQAPVIESYGMTEASHQMTSNRLPPGIRKPGSVGIAAGPDVAIMNEVGTLLPIGELGEVVIRGANVTPGYENHPEANAKAFTNGWFRTGDQGYLDADGYLFLKGRLKEIINRGGEKVSPQEVDAVLMDLPQILQAVTFAVPHPTLGEDVAAAVVLRENAKISEQTIREFLFEQLADFKVPSQVVILDEIPKGPTGKLRRIGLAEQLAGLLKGEYIQPRNELERVVAELFAEVLRIEKISVCDNFFSLGGDSLRGTQVASRIRSIFGVELPNVMLFKKPTVAELADEIARLTESTDATSILEILAELKDLSESEVQKLLADEIERQ